MELSGIVQAIVYHNPENFYSVIKVGVNLANSVVVVGFFPLLSEGENVVLKGEFKVNPKFGRQFMASNIQISYPTNDEGMVRYLSSGLFAGIGPIMARRIVDAFGKDTFDIIEFAPEKMLGKVKGMSIKKAIALRDAFRSKKAFQNVFIFLSEYNISMNLMLKIFKQYGELSKAVVEQNPYRLITDIDGIGFITADAIARKMGIAADSLQRIMAGVIYTLDNEANQLGSTLLPTNKLREKVIAKLNLTESTYKVVDDFLTTEETIGSLAVDTEGHLALLKALPDTELGYMVAQYMVRFENITREALRKDIAVKWGEKLVDDAICQLVLSNHVVELLYGDEPAVMLKRLYNTELSIAMKLKHIVSVTKYIALDVDSYISEYERINSIELHEKQRNAVTAAINSGGLVITGGPGTGKTTIIKCIIYILEKVGVSFALCAPTGRASKRMNMSTGAPAKTIHRLLNIGWSEESNKLMYEFDESNPLKEQVIIVDEVSMCDVHIFFALLRALPEGVKLILVGDKDQLPSVGAGNVLSDIIESHIFPVSYLTEIYRQSKDSYIISNAHLVNRCQMPYMDNKSSDFFFLEESDQRRIIEELKNLYRNRLPKFLGINSSDIQVMAPSKRGICGVNNLNKELQSLVNPSSPKKKEVYSATNSEEWDGTDTSLMNPSVLREGDRVMQTVNNYNIKWLKKESDSLITGKGVFNGDIGVIEYIDNDQNISVLFEDGRQILYSREDRKELHLAYACSIHKSQGSEFDAVIIVIGQYNPMLLTKNLLYTAITRAKKLVMIIGKKQSIAAMVHNTHIETRYTALVQFLRDVKGRLNG